MSSAADGDPPDAQPPINWAAIETVLNRHPELQDEDEDDMEYEPSTDDYSEAETPVDPALLGLFEPDDDDEGNDDDDMDFQGEGNIASTDSIPSTDNLGPDRRRRGASRIYRRYGGRSCGRRRRDKHRGDERPFELENHVR